MYRTMRRALYCIGVVSALGISATTSAQTNPFSKAQVADRIRKVLTVVPPERVYLTTDCGMRPLPRLVAKMKLKALTDGAQIIRNEITG